MLDILESLFEGVLGTVVTVIFILMVMSIVALIIRNVDTGQLVTSIPGGNTGAGIAGGAVLVLVILFLIFE
ncbi:MAG: hypothetical protein ABEK59_10965 [Halobacteria archaeon]